MNTRALACLALTCTLLGGTMVAAEDRPTVVELYTSQGCSSCPPADAILARIAERGDVIALALHVDYWDYIGWKDTFGNPRFTERQKAYARAAGDNMIYTPQMVVNGNVSVVGTDAASIEGALQQAHSGDGPDLTIKRAGDRLSIRAESTAALADGAIVQLVRYRPEESVMVEAGENAGQFITYRNIVTDWSVIGKWDGAAPLTLDVPAAGPQPVVVLLQEPGPGRILAAASAP